MRRVTGNQTAPSESHGKAPSGAIPVVPAAPWACGERVAKGGSLGETNGSQVEAERPGAHLRDWNGSPEKTALVKSAAEACAAGWPARLLHSSVECGEEVRREAKRARGGRREVCRVAECLESELNELAEVRHACRDAMGREHLSSPEEQ